MRSFLILRYVSRQRERATGEGTSDVSGGAIYHAINYNKLGDPIFQQVVRGHVFYLVGTLRGRLVCSERMCVSRLKLIVFNVPELDRSAAR